MSSLETALYFAGSVLFVVGVMGGAGVMLLFSGTWQQVWGKGVFFALGLVGGMLLAWSSVLVCVGLFLD